jgi:hypothetical protein
MQDESWFFDYNKRDVRSVVVHSKNDRRQGSSVVEMVFPRGPLLKLFLAHVFEGHRLLTLERDTPIQRLFVNKRGSIFNDTTFVHYWASLMAQTETGGMTYFAPSFARTSFIEDYTSEFGVDPEMWDGAAIAMGNSLPQWGASYNPSKRSRMAQRALVGHGDYTARRAGELQLRRNSDYEELDDDA